MSDRGTKPAPSFLLVYEDTIVLSDDERHRLLTNSVKLAPPQTLERIIVALDSMTGGEP